MKRGFIITIILSFILGHIIAQPTFTIDVTKPGISISPTLYGIFFEDINHAADGGLYAEMVQNRSFEDNMSTPSNWSATAENGSRSQLSLEKDSLLNQYQKTALKIVVTNANETARAGVINSGFWGMTFLKSQTYTATFFAKCSDQFYGNIVFSLENSNNTIISASDTIRGITTGWKKYSCQLTASEEIKVNGRLKITTTSNGTIWFDIVSLFPPTFKNRSNGNRIDLTSKIVDMNPAFVRFPGGCFVEGQNFSSSFRWKETIGPIEERPGHQNLWGYRTSDGMGFHEWLVMCEDLQAEPLYVANCGMSHDEVAPMDQLESWLQDALDAIEYANGDSTTIWGAKRTENGHREPFNMKLIEIGNENNFNQAAYEPRYKVFYEAIKAKYPEINCIANSLVTISQTDIIDEHYYNTSEFFQKKFHLYDFYDRKGPKIYAGEYAVTQGCGQGNLNAALGEAIYMMGMEKNSDIVIMSSYAPMLVNFQDRKWNPDMINFNTFESYGTPSYWLQNIFSNNLGNVDIPVTETGNIIPGEIQGNIGVGTWVTQAEFSELKVQGSKNEVIFEDNFSDASNWTTYNGTWRCSSNSLKQSGNLTDCRAIAQNINEENFTYTLKARKNSGSEGFLIIFGYKDSQNYYWWNIGGWNNKIHAVEQAVNGTKSTLVSTPGSVSTNKWYDIKIEVNNGMVSCYLDNQLIHKFYIASHQLYCSGSYFENPKELILKVVNPTGKELLGTFEINGFEGNAVEGSSIILSSKNSSDENSFVNPTNVSPSISTIEAKSKKSSFSFLPFSINILRLKGVQSDIVSNEKTESRNQQIKVFPNPATDMLNVINAADGAVYKIFSLDGRLCKQGIIESYTINVGDFQRGIYYMTIESETLSQFKGKFIIK